MARLLGWLFLTVVGSFLRLFPPASSMPFHIFSSLNLNAISTFLQRYCLSQKPMCINATFSRSGNYSYVIPVSKYMPMDVEISLEIK